MSSHREPAANQLLDYAKKQGNDDGPATNTAGEPLPYKDASETAGPKGPMLFQDYQFVDEMAHFDRERIPERVVHAKGAGAFGYFEVTNDVTAYTAASVFASVSKKTPVAVRFSQVTGEMGYPDTVRDPRGFAIKFYTEDGIWDLVGNNTPIFFIRDAVLFASFIHVLKRNPVSHLRDADMFWDFISLRPETTHQIMVLYSDRGIPDGYRFMHGYGSNTFSFINKYGHVSYCKFHYKSDQGVRNIASDRATQIAGEDPDYSTRDLFNNIAKGNFPSWTMYVQIMSQEEAAKYKFDPFDVTKVWYHADFPLIPVGKLVLNRNPSNYFAEIEQIAFNPSHLIPGIGPSPDRMLQGRLFSYGDTHRYRLGTNYQQLPINSAFRVRNFSRDGQQTIDSQGGAPNYHPNSFGGPNSDPTAKALYPSAAIVGNSGRYDNGDEDNFTQARALYRRVLDAGGRARLIDNIAANLKDANAVIQSRAVNNFTQVDEDFGRRLTTSLQIYNHTHTTL